MPFRLTNTPSTFIRLMNHVLKSLIGKCVVIYFDDILIHSNCLNDHILHFKNVLLLLTQECLYASLEKCTFLGYVVSFEGVKTSFKWRDSLEKAFQALKDRLTKAPILVLPNFSKTFELKCDASNVGVGEVLLQEGHPIAYFNEQLKKVWQHYLLPKEFVIHSDHEALKHLRNHFPISSNINKGKLTLLLMPCLEDMLCCLCLKQKSYDLRN
ncbi:Retrovirus-related Pol polyprotein from transposon 17.6, partial [Mucuna pruriens]